MKFNYEIGHKNNNMLILKVGMCRLIVHFIFGTLTGSTKKI